jgi:hypothetical protein
MKVRGEVAKTGVDTRRATEDSAGVLEQYVEESEGAQRSRHAWMRHRSRSFMNYPG